MATLISPQEFAQALYKAPLSEDFKQRILKTLPTLSTADIMHIYKVLEKSAIKYDQALLKLEVEFEHGLRQLKQEAELFLAKKGTT